MKAVAYCRISLEEEKDGTRSIEGQKEIIEEYCKANDVELVGSFVDKGGVELREKRPELDKLLGGEVPEETKAVLVSSTDRIALNFKRFLFYKLELESHGLKIICVDPNADIFSTMMGGACRGAGA